MGTALAGQAELQLTVCCSGVSSPDDSGDNDSSSDWSDSDPEVAAGGEGEDANDKMTQEAMIAHMARQDDDDAEDCDEAFRQSLKLRRAGDTGDVPWR